MMENYKLKFTDLRSFSSFLLPASYFPTRLLFIILLTSGAFFSSCISKGHLPGSTARCRLDYKSAKTLASLLKKNQAEYSTFSGKIKANVKVEDKETSFTVALRMRKDSIIWASISSLGIEAVRFVATKDTLKFIDRLQSKYFVGDYDTLSQLLHTEIDLEVLQSLLVGNSVEFYTEDEKLRAGIDSCQYLLGTIRKRKLRKVIQKGKELKEPAQNIWLQDSTFRISRILFREFESRREFDATFQDFQNVELPEGQTKSVAVPFNILLNIKTDKSASLHMEYTKASANKPQSFPFSVPEGYEYIGRHKK